LIRVKIEIVESNKRTEMKGSGRAVFNIFSQKEDVYKYISHTEMNKKTSWWLFQHFQGEDILRNSLNQSLGMY